VRAKIKRRRHSGEKWREIGASFPGVPLGTLCRIAHDKKYTPKSPMLRAHLGLEPLPIAVTPCPIHGVVHIKRCPGAPSKYQPHPVMRLSKIRRLLQEPYRKTRGSYEKR
jgi:hypothetical protein